MFSQRRRVRCLGGQNVKFFFVDPKCAKAISVEIGKSEFGKSISCLRTKDPRGLAPRGESDLRLDHFPPPPYSRAAAPAAAREGRPKRGHARPGFLHAHWQNATLSIKQKPWSLFTARDKPAGAFIFWGESGLAIGHIHRPDKLAGVFSDRLWLTRLSQLEDKFDSKTHKQRV